MKERNVTNYYYLCNSLKDMVRNGWLIWNVKKDRLESVADHIYKVQMLALAMYSEYSYDIDIEKVILMLSLHELGEIIIGDRTIFDISIKEKRQIEHNAVKEVLSLLNDGEKYEKLILEFDEGKTKEAKFAFFCDKLECDLQSKIYDEEGYVDIYNQPNNKVINNEKVKELLEREKNFSRMWIIFGQNEYNYDENFMKVSNYALEKSIINNNFTNNIKEENVLKFYYLCTKLSNTIRKGWLNYNINRKRIESVAEHIFKVQMLALAMNSEYNYNLDIKKITYMIAVHELEEIIIGDVAMTDPNYKLEKLKGEQAVKEVLSPLEDKDYICSLVDEFENKKTKEAIFAYHCDKLECDLQAKLYDEEKCFDLNNLDKLPEKLKVKVKQKIDSGLNTFTEIWFSGDEYLYNDDENFKKVFNYAKTNKISLKR